MPKRPTAYYRPKSLAEALELLAHPDTYPLAGGTRLLAHDVQGTAVDLQDLGLNQLHWDENGAKRLRVGATTRLADWIDYLAQEEDSAGPLPLLSEAVRRAGPNTYRNAATVGGIVAGRLPDSELLATLLVLQAELTLYPYAAREGVSLSLSDYLAAAERPTGLITELRLVWERGQGRSERVARTPADDPIVSVVLWQPAERPLRLAATGLMEHPGRLTAAEAALATAVTETTIEEASTAVRQSSRHPGDFRGDAAYRAEMGAVLTRRLLQNE